MANTSLTDFTPVIKQQIAILEELQERLTKAEALAHVALSDDFFDYEKSIIHAYLWALGDMISDAKHINEQAHDVLLKSSNF